MTKKEFRVQRAKWELSVRVMQTISNYVSKEEPTVKLSARDKADVLLDIFSSKFKKLK